MTDRSTVLTTGCSTAVGRIAAKTFQRSGWNVIASMRAPEAERELDALDRVLVTALDVRDADSIHSAIQAGVERFGTVHCLVNNAGFPVGCPVSGLIGVAPDPLRRAAQSGSSLHPDTKAAPAPLALAARAAAALQTD